MFKIMQSGPKYDRSTATQQNNLFYSIYQDTPKIEIGTLVFYELHDLLKLKELSISKKNSLSNVKEKSSVQLFNVGKERYFYAVLLTKQEEKTLQKLKIELESISKINEEIEKQVGHLLKQKKIHEKNIKDLKILYN